MNINNNNWLPRAIKKFEVFIRDAEIPNRKLLGIKFLLRHVTLMHGVIYLIFDITPLLMI